MPAEVSRNGQAFAGGTPVTSTPAPPMTAEAVPGGPAGNRPAAPADDRGGRTDQREADQPVGDAVGDGVPQRVEYGRQEDGGDGGQRHAGRGGGDGKGGERDQREAPCVGP